MNDHGKPPVIRSNAWRTSMIHALKTLDQDSATSSCRFSSSSPHASHRMTGTSKHRAYADLRGSPHPEGRD